MPTLKVKNNGVWEKVSGGGSGGGGSELPTGGTAGQFLSIGSDGKPVWADAPSNIPSGGTTGQVLTIGEDGNIVWANVTGGNNTLPAAEEVEL